MSSFKIHRFLNYIHEGSPGVVKCIRVQKPKGKKRPKRNSNETQKKMKNLDEQIFMYEHASTQPTTRVLLTIRYIRRRPNEHCSQLNTNCFQNKPKKPVWFIELIFVFFQSIVFVGVRRGCGNQWIYYYYYAINTLYILCPGPVHSVYRSIFPVHFLFFVGIIYNMAPVL